MYFILQSPHEFRWILVARVSGVCRVMGPLLHHQSVLNVHVQRILGHDLDIINHFYYQALTLEANMTIASLKQCKHTYISFFVLRQQLMDRVSEQSRVALRVLTDALHQPWIFFSQIIQLHKERHLLPMGQCNLSKEVKQIVSQYQ